MADIDTLIDLLQGIVDGGRSVIVIEHSLDVIARADWVIDLGPGAGSGGGRVVFEGPPAQLVDCAASLTGQALRAYAGSPPPPRRGPAQLMSRRRNTAPPTATRTTLSTRR